MLIDPVPVLSKPRHPATWAGPLLLLPLLLCACDILGLGDDEPREPTAGETTVLFIGSSYLAFYDVPQRVKGFAREAGEPLFIETDLVPGKSLESFAADPLTTLKIRERSWDFVVLQGGASAAAYPAGHGPVATALGHRPIRPALQDLARKATELSPGTRVIYMMPWAYEDGITWIEGQTDGYVEMQLEIRANSVAWADELGLVVAPVGMAFHRIMTSWDPPEHFLFQEDWNHANATGAYLTAATLFSTLFSRSPVGLGYDWEVERDLARRLREVAGSTVMDSLALWNLDAGG